MILWGKRKDVVEKMNEEAKDEYFRVTPGHIAILTPGISNIYIYILYLYIYIWKNRYSSSR